MSDEYEGNKRREMRWEQMRGTPPPKSTDEVWKERHLLQEQHITQLENRLRVLWDKYYGDLNYYMERIKRLEDAGDEAIHEAAHGREHDALEIWRKAKEAKP